VRRVAVPEFATFARQVLKTIKPTMLEDIENQLAGGRSAVVPSCTRVRQRKAGLAKRGRKDPWMTLTFSFQILRRYIDKSFPDQLHRIIDQRPRARAVRGEKDDLAARPQPRSVGHEAAVLEQIDGL
jgi:hypothetical protein